jgi:inactivated superfamily I helicase
MHKFTKPPLSMPIHQKIVFILAGSTLSFAVPAEAVLAGSIRLAGRGAGVVLGYELWTARKETGESWSRFSTTVADIHKKHTETALGSAYPICDQLAATMHEIGTEVQKHLQEKSSVKTPEAEKNTASVDTTAEKNTALVDTTKDTPSVGKIIYEDGSFLLIQGLKAAGAYRLIRGK